MKHQQGKYMIGYIIVIIEGKYIEEVLQAYIEMNYPVWDITRETGTTCRATIYRHHLNDLEKLAENKNMTISKVKVGGGTSYFHKLFRKKEWILSVCICFVLLFLIGNTAWKVEVQGVSVHLEDKIKASLSKEGLYQGAWTYNLASLDYIQDQLLHELSELQYLGIQKRGTTYKVEAIEKKIEKQPPSRNVDQLIAKKSGVIQKMFIKSGNPVVEINDFVERGDPLVTNEVHITDTTDEDTDEDIKKVPVNGKVFANTWYDIAITATLQPSHDKLTGEKMTKYKLQLADKTFPIWGFSRQPYEQNVINEHHRPLNLWKWKLPVEIVEQNIYEYEGHSLKRSVKDTEEVVIEHVINHLRVNLGQDIEILKYYILHETVENGKVKMNIYFSILENIATTK